MDTYKQKPLLSVRLMTYNHEKFIHQAMESILSQKVDFPVEVVVGDDFSTDNTLSIIRKFKSTKSIHIHILERAKGDEYWKKRQAQGRIYNFINILENCKGKYIALLDGDDYWTDPLKLQKQVDFLEAHSDFVGVFHNTGFIDERCEKPTLTSWRSYEQDVFVAKDTIRKLSLFHTSSYFFRNLKYDFSLLYSPGLISADMLLLGLISKHGKLKLLHDTMSVYRKNLGGLTSNESKLNYHKNRIVLNKVLNTYFNYKFTVQVKSVIKHHKKELFKLKYPRFYKIKRRILKKIL